MYVKDTAKGKLVQAVKNIAIKPDQTLMVVVGEKDPLNIEDFINEMNALEINFFGGVFPAVLYGDKHYDHGAAVIAFPAWEKPVLIKNVDQENSTIPGFNIVPNIYNRKPTAMVLVDGLTANVAGFLANLYGHLGNSVNYLGGGAGSISLEQKPCLFTNDGLYQGAAIIALIDLNCKLGVRHGWEKIAGPVVATRTDKNKIIQLNWRNAFKVYKIIVESDLEQQITADNFFEVAKAYPFGMLKQYEEKVVRDPLALDDEGRLICVGEVPENSVLDILKGKPDSLIKAAGQAAADCVIPAENKVKNRLIFDCVSRVLFLGKHFKKELEAINQHFKPEKPNIVPVGMLTLGEISSYGNGFLEFFNKTVVSGVLYE